MSTSIAVGYQANGAHARPSGWSREIGMGCSVKSMCLVRFNYWIRTHKWTWSSTSCRRDGNRCVVYPTVYILEAGARSSAMTNGISRAAVPSATSADLIGRHWRITDVKIDYRHVTRWIITCFKSFNQSSCVLHNEIWNWLKINS